MSSLPRLERTARRDHLPRGHPTARDEDRLAGAIIDFLRSEAVLDALGELEREPTDGHQLRGRLAGLWSYRVGAYRIIYQLRDAKTVRVIAIRHRGQAYEADPR